MNDGRQIAERYQLLTEHQAGGTAVIYKALDLQTHTIVAIKVFRADKLDPAIIDIIWDREHSALAKLAHPAVVKLLDAGRDELTNERYLVLEWIDGVTLEQFLNERGPLDWYDFLNQIGRDVLEALVHAAERNIAHRDLSTSNILVSPSGQLKIIDFGQAKLQEGGIGRTVMSFKTVPYCLPEEDTGTFTYTRDPYSFCALAVRALHGKPLKDHEELYAALQSIEMPLEARAVVEAALHRDPQARFPTIIEFGTALDTPQKPLPVQDAELLVPYRFDPAVHEGLRHDADGSEDELNTIALELNDLVCVSPANDQSHLILETRSHRMIAARDPVTRDQLVIVKVTAKHFKVDALFRGDRWQPNATFTKELPRRPDQRARASESVTQFYERLEDFLDEMRRNEQTAAGDSFAAWSNLLEAMRFIARTAVPEVRYSRLVREGRRLIATVENPHDLTEQEFRTISINESWVFRGEVEAIEGSQCTLLSTRAIDFDRIPSQGVLEVDWQQTRTALDRQGKALEKFKSNETPNPSLANLLAGADHGPEEVNYTAVTRFFDNSLDDSKRLIVSQLAAHPDLVVIHGPPGTGKTKLIVELIRQELQSNPHARILLASQTHVALDNALERLLAASPGISCVRIGSGSREASPGVAETSVEQRSSELRQHVTKSAHQFLLTRATELGVDQREVELGLAVMEVVGVYDETSRQQSIYSELEGQAAELRAKLDESTSQTSDHQASLARVKQLEEALVENSEELARLKATGIAAAQRLAVLGDDGKVLSTQNVGELREWAELLVLGSDAKRELGELIKLSEAWRLRFAQSDDFKAAIIASSSVVAGTCVGFCREEAAVRTLFDVCIVDEAAKATTTELLVPLAQARRAILLGDHHQLPAVLDHEIKSPTLLAKFNITTKQIEEQMFETLAKDLNPGATGKLTIQHRMRGEIGRLVSECFYDGELFAGDSITSRTPIDLSHAGLVREVTWLDPYANNKDAANERSQGKSYYNYIEAASVVALLRRILFVIDHVAHEDVPTIGVISGYAPQVALIQTLIRKSPELDKLNVECASVHAFQGREVDICIYCVTRRNPHRTLGMTKDWRHLNVALSRARDFLVIVGDRDFCRTAKRPNPFEKTLAFIENSAACEIKGVHGA